MRNGNIYTINILIPVLVVGEPEVDKKIEIVRKQRATFEPAERAAEQGDRLTITYRGTIDDNEFSGSSARDQAVVLGDGRRLPDFDKRLLGMKAGEVKTFELR